MELFSVVFFFSPVLDVLYVYRLLKQIPSADDNKELV